MKNANKKFMLIALLAFSTCLSSCGANTEWTDENLPTKGDVVINVDDVVTNDGEFHTKTQLAYINSSWDKVSKFASGVKELSIPNGNVIDLTSETEYDYFELSLDQSFANTKLYSTSKHQKSMVYNLLSDKTYYFRSSNDKTNFEGKTVHELKVTSALPRNLNIEGVTNVRDLGGYTSKLGGKVKQNMFIRGGKLTGGSTTPSAYITSNGLKMLTKNIGVKTEIDLRMSEESDNNPENGHMSNDFFKDIEYKSVPINYGNTNMLIDCKEQMKEVFTIYSEEQNYPCYVHCSIGTDRTGVVSYLMGALLGISNEELYKDYLFSNFGNIGGSRDEGVIKLVYYPTLIKYGKETLAECAKAYLMDIGLTEEQVDNIRNIMIEK